MTCSNVLQSVYTLFTSLLPNPDTKPRSFVKTSLRLRISIMKYIASALLLILVSLTCCGQNSPDLSNDSTRSDTNVSDFGWIHTTYEYTNATGKRLIIQNSLPKGDLYTDANGNEYAKATFWTRIINETDNPLEFTIDFSGHSYEFPGSVGASGVRYYKLILPSDTLTRDKVDLYNYGLTDFDATRIGKSSSLTRTVNPKESNGFYVVWLAIVLKSDKKSVQADGSGVTRAGFSINGQNLFYTLNGKAIPCGKINLTLK